MKPPEFVVTETFRSGSEAERRAALQRAVDQYLSRALEDGAPLPKAPAPGGAEDEG